MSRDRFKPTQLGAMQQADQQLQTMTGMGDRPGIHSIKEGSNIFRLYPAHPDSKSGFYVPKAVTFLPFLVVEKDQSGKEIKDRRGQVQMKTQYRPVFDAKIHGNQKMDIIEEYRKAVLNKAKEQFDDEAGQKKFTFPLYGKIKTDDRGIQTQVTWVVYADRIQGDSHTFGRLELKKSVKNRLNTIASTENEDDPLGTDPFTDPDDGRAINIVYNPRADQPVDFYKTELYAPVLKGTGGKIQLYPLSDEQLEFFDSQPTLDSLYVNVYKRSDFDLALEGLQNFDEHYGFGIFDDPSFQLIIDQLKSQLPVNSEEEEVEEEIVTKPAPTKTKQPIQKQKVEEEESEGEEDEDEEEEPNQAPSRTDRMNAIRERANARK